MNDNFYFEPIKPSLEFFFKDGVPSFHILISEVYSATGLEVNLMQMTKPDTSKLASSQKIKEVFAEMGFENIHIPKNFDDELILSGFITFSGQLNDGVYFCISERGFLLSRNKEKGNEYLIYSIAGKLIELGGELKLSYELPNWVGLRYDDIKIPKEMKVVLSSSD